FDQSFASPGGIHYTATCQILRNTSPPLRAIVRPIVKVCRRGLRGLSDELKRPHSLRIRNVFLQRLGCKVPIIRIDIVIPVGMTGKFPPPVILGAVVSSALPKKAKYCIFELSPLRREAAVRISRQGVVSSI